MCKDDNRMREVTGVLENLTEADRTIIFASKKEDIINVYKVNILFLGMGVLGRFFGDFFQGSKFFPFRVEPFRPGRQKHF